ncbi:MAG: hypothetical protein RR505_13715, partial [Raoultibacter sp.]
MDIREVSQEDRSPELIETLVNVWERSVRETHDFLTENDIAAISSEVPCALATIALLALAYVDDRPVA